MIFDFTFDFTFDLDVSLKTARCAAPSHLNKVQHSHVENQQCQVIKSIKAKS